MTKFYLIICALLVARFMRSDGFQTDGEEIDVEEAVEFYNSLPELSWKAGPNELGDKVTISELKSNLGWIPRKKEQASGKTSKTSSTTSTTSSTTSAPTTTPRGSELPSKYDCRAAFPKCTTIASIKDQSNCGSCWAVATAAVFSDRICIHSNGTSNYNMSANQLLACDKKSHGCDGGYLDSAWKYIADHGLVTGGDYGSNEGCQDYSIPPKQSIFAPPPKTPECREENCTTWFKAKDKTFTSTSHQEYLLRKEIYENGPLTAGFTVYLSFRFYEKGIYKKLLIDLPLGGHAVRVIGWGEEKGEKYWLVANSWGRKWGENGLFRIRRGTNECGIESSMIAALPHLH